MNWLLVGVIILALSYIINNYKKRKRKRGALHYLRSNWGKEKESEEFNFDLIRKYFENSEALEAPFHIISDSCAADLDIDEVFKKIDRTSSKIGQQYLYCKIRTIEGRENLAKFDALTQLFEATETLRVNAQMNLLKLGSKNAYRFEELVTSEPIKKPKIIWLVYTLSILSFLLVVMSFLYPVLVIALIPVLAINMVFHYRNKWRVSSYLEGVSQLSLALKVSKTLIAFPEIKELFVDTSFIKEIQKIKLKTEFVSFEKRITNEFALFFWMVPEFIKVLFNLEYILFYSFIDSITSKKNELKKMFHFIGEIDAAISTASIKSSDNKICTPKFIDKKKIEVSKLYHPLINNCIVNDLSLIDSSLLLTGSNMSGKTTFIRNVGVNSILAQTLNICFGEKYCAPYFKLYSSIRITDDLLKSKSYYLAEVLTVNELVKASRNGSPCLFVLDEIFKGTNTVERISGGKAILSYLNNSNNIVLVSTHDIELTDILNEEKFELYHFNEQINNGELTFDHKIKKGKLKTRNAIKILELYQYPLEIIEDAKRTEEMMFVNDAVSAKL